MSIVRLGVRYSLAGQRSCADGGCAPRDEGGAGAAVQLMGELDRAGQSERFGPVVLYVLLTQDDEALREFGAALRRVARQSG